MIIVRYVIEQPPSMLGSMTSVSVLPSNVLLICAVLVLLKQLGEYCEEITGHCQSYGHSEQSFLLMMCSSINTHMMIDILFVYCPAVPSAGCAYCTGRGDHMDHSWSDHYCTWPKRPFGQLSGLHKPSVYSTWCPYVTDVSNVHTHTCSQTFPVKCNYAPISNISLPT